MTSSPSATRRRVALGVFAMLLSSGAWAAGVCSNAANTLLNACTSQKEGDYLVATVTCQNIVDGAARSACLADAQATRKDDQASCKDVYQARLGVCNVVGEARYEPPFGPDFANTFVDPTDIGGAVLANPYLPLLPGAQWKYVTTYRNDSGVVVTEHDTVTVTKRRKLIDGITCVVVTDVVISTDGSVENTEDWFAQDTAGNVWYCGEITEDEQTFAGDVPASPELVDIEGSWKTAREGGKPGIQMLAHPVPGKSYRQELLWDVAEDAATVLSVHANESVSGGKFTCNGQCVETYEFSGLEPDDQAHKFYAPGIGMILEVDLSNGARNELVSFTP